eukprot:Tbor_TRINITY_DN5514_c3_g1::TRINITY_DN5514_c3_g1_i13::g.13377::m.13377/K16465/CETN1; centrin-1
MSNITNEQIRAVFDLFDADGSGFVDTEELSMALQSLGFGILSQEQIEIMMRKRNIDDRPRGEYDIYEEEEMENNYNINNNNNNLNNNNNITHPYILSVPYYNSIKQYRELYYNNNEIIISEMEDLLEKDAERQVAIQEHVNNINNNNYYN